MITVWSQNDFNIRSGNSFLKEYIVCVENIDATLVTSKGL